MITAETLTWITCALLLIALLLLSLILVSGVDFEQWRRLIRYFRVSYKQARTDDKIAAGLLIVFTISYGLLFMAAR